MSTMRGLYVITGVSLLGAYVLCRWITRSKLGKVLEAIRDGENRVRFSGYSPVGFKLFVFVVAAAIAGLAGALYVPQVGIINPSRLEPAESIEIAIWVAVGGRGTLSGAILGALVVNAVKSWLDHPLPRILALRPGEPVFRRRRHAPAGRSRLAPRPARRPLEAAFPSVAPTGARPRGRCGKRSRARDPHRGSGQAGAPANRSSSSKG
jgi:urea transport system permease protein